MHQSWLAWTYSVPGTLNDTQTIKAASVLSKGELKQLQLLHMSGNFPSFEDRIAPASAAKIHVTLVEGLFDLTQWYLSFCRYRYNHYRVSRFGHRSFVLELMASQQSCLQQLPKSVRLSRQTAKVFWWKPAACDVLS